MLQYNNAFVEKCQKVDLPQKRNAEIFKKKNTLNILKNDNFLVQNISRKIFEVNEIIF